MGVPSWIWGSFAFAFGACIGSFLNVVIYRLPRDKSLVTPGSACPSCGRSIRFYDNIPLLSWLLLGGKCRHCKGRISFRYFAIELLTGCIFAGLYVLYFVVDFRRGMSVEGAWLVYFAHIALLAAFIAASGIDMEHWVIPLSICWFVTALGLVVSGTGPFLIDPEAIARHDLLPVASPRSAAMALGAAAGLACSMILLVTGVFKRSYAFDNEDITVDAEDQQAEEYPYNHRLESCKELLFLAPIIIGAVAGAKILGPSSGIGERWSSLVDNSPAVAGVLGSLWGYFVGCAIVWGTRIGGTLVFGKEAMGLGDVHLLGAAGTVIGPIYVVIAFFVAPFMGLGWAFFQMFSKKIRQIPYGPFLSLGVLAVMIFQDSIRERLLLLFR